MKIPKYNVKCGWGVMSILITHNLSAFEKTLFFKITIYRCFSTRVVEITSIDCNQAFLSFVLLKDNS